ncbi:MAG TPA: hypothetical protein VLI39_18190 [Sedimentisphaerales bacterium]|nr:hypothetical protein [Sedimentisphaerales bacterium]
MQRVSPADAVKSGVLLLGGQNISGPQRGTAPPETGNSSHGDDGCDENTGESLMRAQL